MQPTNHCLRPRRSRLRPATVSAGSEDGAASYTTGDASGFAVSVESSGAQDRRNKPNCPAQLLKLNRFASDIRPRTKPIEPNFDGFALHGHKWMYARFTGRAA